MLFVTEKQTPRSRLSDGDAARRHILYNRVNGSMKNLALRAEITIEAAEKSESAPGVDVKNPHP